MVLINFLIFILGASLGSFVNLFIYRREKNLDFIVKDSFCENCNIKIKKTDLIPVFSFIILGGRCRNCNKKIRISLFIFELISGIIFLISFNKFNLSINFLILSLELLILLGISYLDFTTGYIYTFDVIILFVLEFIYKIVNNLNLIEAFLAAGAIGIVIFIIIFITHGMGIGDLQLFFVAGFIGGIENTFLIFTLSFVIAAIVSIFLILLKKKSRKDYIAFGPYIAMALTIIILW